MIADNFELEEQPPADNEVVDDHECLMDINSTSVAADADVTFTTAKATDADDDDNDSNIEYEDYHDILKQVRNDSEGTADTEQSFDSTGSGTNNIIIITHQKKSQEMKLLLTFVLMVVVGTGMKIFQKLQAIPYVYHFCSLNTYRRILC